MSTQAWVDMHMHSTFSDGTYSPTDLVSFAIRKGLKAIALSDHDSVDGFTELAAAGAENGMEVMSGVELSCVHNGRDLHILGYGIDTTSQALAAELSKFRDTREDRGMKIIDKLAEVGVHIDKQAVLAKAGEGALGRPHIAEALLEAGYVSEFGEAFDKYIGEDGPAYVDKYKMTPADAVRHIHDAGGVALIAHPGSLSDSKDDFYELLDKGFDGIEVYHPHHSNSMIARLEAMVEERGMLMSGGSDFHGFKGRDNMGQPHVSYELYEKIRERVT